MGRLKQFSQPSILPWEYMKSPLIDKDLHNDDPFFMPS